MVPKASARPWTSPFRPFLSTSNIIPTRFRLSAHWFRVIASKENCFISLNVPPHFLAEWAAGDLVRNEYITSCLRTTLLLLLRQHTLWKHRDSSCSLSRCNHFTHMHDAMQYFVDSFVYLKKLLFVCKLRSRTIILRDDVIREHWWTIAYFYELNWFITELSLFCIIQRNSGIWRQT